MAQCSSRIEFAPYRVTSDFFSNKFLRKTIFISVNIFRARGFKNGINGQLELLKLDDNHVKFEV